MAEFSEVIKQAKRMCEAHLDCKDCALNQSTIKVDCIGQKNSGHPPFNWDEAINSEFERIVMEWAKAHPEPRYPSWNEVRKRLFPDAALVFCPKMLVSRMESHCNSMPNCDVCRKQPIPADIADKLGIKPIGGEE